jgi:hypothetical protein
MQGRFTQQPILLLLAVSMTAGCPVQTVLHLQSQA